MEHSDEEIEYLDSEITKQKEIIKRYANMLERLIETMKKENPSWGSYRHYTIYFTEEYRQDIETELELLKVELNE